MCKHMNNTEKMVYNAYNDCGRKYAVEFYHSLETVVPDIMPFENIIKKWDKLTKRKR